MSISLSPDLFDRFKALFKNGNLFLWLGTISVFAILFESFTYPGSLQKNLLIPVWLPAVISFLYSAYFSLVRAKPVASVQGVLLLLLNFLTAVFTVLLFRLEMDHFPNYVFSTFHIDLLTFRWLSFYLLGLLFVTQVRFLTYEKLFIVPFVFLCNLWALSHSFPNVFLTIGVESGLVESIQLGVLVSTLMMSIPILRKAKRFKLPQSFTGLVILLGLALVFLTGEEISWGQHIFHFPSLPFFLQHNVQKEDTIHNLRVVQDVLFNTYILIGGVGTFGWLVLACFSHIKNTFFENISRFVPSKWLSSFFFPMFIYGVVRVFRGPVQIKTWEESCELLAYIGFLLVFHQLWILVQNKRVASNVGSDTLFP